MDLSPTGSSLQGILQAKLLEWAAMPSPGSDQTWVCLCLLYCRQIPYPLSHLGSLCLCTSKPKERPKSCCLQRICTAWCRLAANTCAWNSLLDKAKSRVGRNRETWSGWKEQLGRVEGLRVGPPHSAIISLQWILRTLKKNVFLSLAVPGLNVVHEIFNLHCGTQEFSFLRFIYFGCAGSLLLLGSL